MCLCVCAYGHICTGNLYSQSCRLRLCNAWRPLGCVTGGKQPPPPFQAHDYFSNISTTTMCSLTNIITNLKLLLSSRGGDTETVNTVASSQFYNYRQCNSLSGRLRDGLLGLSLLKHVSKHIEGTLCNKEEVGEGCGEFTGDVALSQQ